jgi:hypothetical protein
LTSSFFNEHNKKSYSAKVSRMAKIKNLSYRLKIEWANLETYFTHKDDGIVTDWYTRGELKDFFNDNDYPFSLKMVEYNPEYFATCNGFGDNVDAIITDYNLNYKAQNFNFLAQDPFSDMKLIVRTNDLVFFPKFFENWIVEELTYQNTPHHISDFYNLKNELYYQSKKSDFINNISFAQLLLLTLNFSHITNDNVSSVFIQSMLSQYQNTYKDMKEIFEIKNIVESRPSWLRFCMNVKSWYYPKNPESFLTNKIGPIDLPFKSLQTAFDCNLSIAKLLHNAMFFNDYLRIGDNETRLLETLPIKINDKTKTIIV